jgi:biopolymer transport protein ExbB/TolQ
MTLVAMVLVVLLVCSLFINAILIDNTYDEQELNKKVMELWAENFELKNKVEKLQKELEDKKYGLS